MNTYFRIDENGYYNGVCMADSLPEIENEIWIEVRPPNINFRDQRVKWTGSEWIIEDIEQ